MEEPLTEQRIRDLLDALDRFGGDHLRFHAMLNGARYGGSAPPELAGSGLDPVRLSDDLTRLELIWNMTGGEFQPGGAGTDAAFASFDLLAGAWAAGSGGPGG